MDSLKGRVALVTGAGRGLGAEIGKALGAEGAAIAVADIRGDLAEESAAGLMTRRIQTLACTLDISDERAAASVIERIERELGPVDILVNNAAVDVTCSIEELKFEDWDRVLATNLRGPLVMAKLMFPRMRERGAGMIVNIVSTAAKRAWANAACYHSSKWGLLGLSHAMHVEGRQHNIKVSAILAGGMKTPFLFDRFPDINPDLLQDPANVAAAVVFVCTQPKETVVPEMMVLPMRETSWP